MVHNRLIWTIVPAVISIAAGTYLSVSYFGNLKDKKDTIQDIYGTIESVDTLGELFQMRDTILVYCQLKYTSKKHARFDYENRCQKELLQKLQTRGDVIKEKIIREIDNLPHNKQIKAIMDAHTVLLAGENARGEGVLFSTDNISWARKELKKKADQWVLNELKRLKNYSGDKSKKAVMAFKALLRSFETASGSEGRYVSNNILRQAKTEIAKIEKNNAPQGTRPKEASSRDNVVLADKFEANINLPQTFNNQESQTGLDTDSDIQNLNVLASVLYGRWKSLDTNNFFFELHTDNSCVIENETDTDSVCRWSIQLDGNVYVLSVLRGSTNEATNYIILSNNKHELELLNVPTGEHIFLRRD